MDVVIRSQQLMNIILFLFPMFVNRFVNTVCLARSHTQPKIVKRLIVCANDFVLFVLSVVCSSSFVGVRLTAGNADSFNGMT